MSAILLVLCAGLGFVYLIEEIAKLEEFGNFLPLEPLRIPF